MKQVEYNVVLVCFYTWNHERRRVQGGSGLLLSSVYLYLLSKLESTQDRYKGLVGGSKKMTFFSHNLWDICVFSTSHISRKEGLSRYASTFLFEKLGTVIFKKRRLSSKGAMKETHTPSWRCYFNGKIKWDIMTNILLRIKLRTFARKCSRKVTSMLL